ncbi:MAG TPA: cupredoxin family copper-binding protein [Candidatus Limnocylindrales bacterium]|jgi:plastocyanin|nr:cupredoxin family copper-binding protein [Candidatus Limnocylindrales bacterium]
MDARPLTPAISRRRRFFAPPALAIAAIAVAGSAVLAADASVSIVNFAFDPATVTVDVGDSVTWTNNDSVGHTATADGGSFDTGSIGGGQSDSVTFTAAGSFPYHCTIHPQMTGTVVVQGAAPTPAPTPAPPAPGATPGGTTPPTDVLSSRQPGSSAPIGALVAILAAGATAFGWAVRRDHRRAVG